MELQDQIKEKAKVNAQWKRVILKLDAILTKLNNSEDHKNPAESPDSSIVPLAPVETNLYDLNEKDIKGEIESLFTDNTLYNDD